MASSDSMRPSTNARTDWMDGIDMDKRKNNSKLYKFAYVASCKAWKREEREKWKAFNAKPGSADLLD